MTRYKGESFKGSKKFDENINNLTMPKLTNAMPSLDANVFANPILNPNQQLPEIAPLKKSHMTSYSPIHRLKKPIPVSMQIVQSKENTSQ